MTATENISVEYNRYGCPIIEKCDGCYLSFSNDSENSITIKGNEKGLRLLAKSIVGLINYQLDDGFHIHLDETYDINKENKTINLSKL